MEFPCLIIVRKNVLYHKFELSLNFENNNFSIYKKFIKLASTVMESRNCIIILVELQVKNEGIRIEMDYSING